MPSHICETCERVFKQKGHLITHLKRKNPCKKDDTIEKIVEKKVNEVLEKKASSRSIKVATLFSGIGSVEHALDTMKIPHSISFACDTDKYVKQAYMANYKLDDKLWFTDVTTLDATPFIDDNIDLLVGGSPCQSFSTVGKQAGMDDIRGTLIFQFIRIVNECRPKIFIFENVKGLTTHNRGKTFEVVLDAFRQTGYNILYDVLNAKDYGIPQSRQRLFLIGRRLDSQVNVNFPPPKVELTCTMKDFLEDNVDSKYALNTKGQDFVVKPSNIAKKYTQVNGDIALCQKRNQQYNWFGDFVFEAMPIPPKYTLSEKVQDYVLASGTKTFKTSTETDLDIARPILSSVHKMHRAGIDNYITQKNGRLRKLTPRECLRLMGFRDTFKIVVSDTRCYQHAGNSIVVDVFIHILSNVRF